MVWGFSWHVPYLREGDWSPSVSNKTLSTPLFLFHGGICGAEVLLGEGFSQGSETISQTLRSCWGLSRPWRTQGTGLSLPKSGSPLESQPSAARDIREKEEVVESQMDSVSCLPEKG